MSEDFWPPPKSKLLAAFEDFWTSISKPWIWSMLAAQDIKLRYRRSVLGPFWITLTTAITIGVIGGLYSRVLSVSLTGYVPYVAIGLVIWLFAQATLAEASLTFVESEAAIQQVALPFSVYPLRVVSRNAFVLLHNMILIPPLILLFKLPVGLHSLLVIPGLALLIANALWLTIFLGMAGARFRDIGPLINALMQLLFFVTPIFWPIEFAGDWAGIVALNPFYASIDLIRGPLLGVDIHSMSWSVALGSAILGWVMTFILFAKHRNKIPLWV